MPFENCRHARTGTWLACRNQMSTGLEKDPFNPDKKMQIQDEVVAGVCIAAEPTSGFLINEHVLASVCHMAQMRYV